MSMSKRLNEEEEQEERWSEGLPDDILQSIPQRLCISNFQAFRQVCPNWGAAVNRGIATRTCFPAPQLPWLLLRKAYDSLHAFSIENQFSCVRDPNIFPSIKIADSPPDPPNLDDESIDMNSLGFLPNASLVCLGSIGSWLIVAAHQRCENQNSTTVINFFLNPVSHVRVMLPPQSTLDEASFGNNILKSTFLFKKMVASSPPGLQEEDCVVAAITRPGNDLAFCRPNDAEWTLIPNFPRCTDIEIFDGKLGAVTEGNMMLMVFDMAPEDANVTRAHRLLGFCPVPFPYLLVNTEPCLAKDYESKEVFLVLRKKNIKEGFKVYKTNDKVDHPDGMRWELVTDLGDRTLFLSEQSNRVIKDKTLGRNCIYFAFMIGWNNGGFGVYSLKASTIKPLHFPEDCSATTSNGGISRSLWFTPYPC